MFAKIKAAYEEYAFIATATVMSVAVIGYAVTMVVLVVA